MIRLCGALAAKPIIHSIVTICAAAMVYNKSVIYMDGWPRLRFVRESFQSVFPAGYSTKYLGIGGQAMKSRANMNKRERLEMIIIAFVFFFYVLLLGKMLFLSRASAGTVFDAQRDAGSSVNLIPFASIWAYLFGGSELVKQFALGNVLGNIVVFVPLGAYLALYYRDRRTLTDLLAIFIVSLLVETVQWFFGLGIADVDDVILNCLGGLTGILGYKLLCLVFRGPQKAQTAIAVLSVLGLPIVFYLLFFIHMRF